METQDTVIKPYGLMYFFANVRRFAHFLLTGRQTCSSVTGAAAILRGGGGSGWTPIAFVVAALGAAGGLLVALSIKYGDSILKTLATTGAIVLSSVLDHWWLKGPLTPPMIIAGCQVIVAICNYTFDTTPTATHAPSAASMPPADFDDRKKPNEGDHLRDEEMASLLQPSASAELAKMKRQASRDSIHDG